MTMILVDMNQISIANLMAQLGKHTNAVVSEEMFRHMILNSIRSINSKFRAEYGEMIICCDSTNNWRRDLFPFYKAGRRKASAASDIDWSHIFSCINMMKNDLREYFPYRVIEVDRAEADDVIGVLTHYWSGQDLPERILIVSGDKDFMQLQTYPNVAQYDPVYSKALKLPKISPDLFLREHILRGDVGDGIPNVLSDDDTFVDSDKKQRPLTKKKMEVLLSNETVDAETSARIERNRRLIDLTQIPQDIAEKILKSFRSQKHTDRAKLMSYFMSHGLRQLLEKMGDF